MSAFLHTHDMVVDCDTVECPSDRYIDGVHLFDDAVVITREKVSPRIREAKEFEWSPSTFGEVRNTLSSCNAAGLSHVTLAPGEISEFQAARLLETGYVIKYDERAAKAILDSRMI